MSHRLISAQAARLNTGAAASAMASAPLNTPPAGPAAPAASSESETIDVVAATEAHAAVAHAETVGASKERARFCAVLNSEAGQGNVPLATFMLENNPSASAEAIIAHLDKQPKAAAPATAPVAEAPAVTTPLANTPLITVSAGSNTGQDEPDPKHADKVWESAAASTGPGMGAAAGNLAPGIPRTGN